MRGEGTRGQNRGGRARGGRCALSSRWGALGTGDSEERPKQRGSQKRSSSNCHAISLQDWLASNDELRRL